MLLYVSTTTARINYITQFIFEEQLGIPYTITTNIDEFNEYTDAKINYSEAVTNAPLYIKPVSLLHEEAVIPQTINTVQYKAINCPYATISSILPFDLFAAIFYLITRYEEYLPHQQDAYGRYGAKQSFAFKNNFLQLPIIDSWIADFKKILKQQYPQLIYKEKQFTAQMTYDIDTAYAFKARSVGITIGGLLRDFWYRNYDFIKRRFNTVFGNETDLYDTYNHIIATNKGIQKPIFFFLIGDRSQYNKNIFFQSQGFINLIDTIKAQQFTIGLHPSYNSPRDGQLLSTEKERLEYVSKLRITKSRQHFLRFYLPTTYNKLAAIGITDEYSMVYPTLPGFRASTCNSFYFYDVVSDAQTNLRIHPAAFMEGTFAEDLQYSPQQALQQMLELINEVKKVNGSFICIWHNHSLCEYGVWKGWRNVHDEIINSTTTNG